MSHKEKSQAGTSILPFLGLACGVGVSTIYYNQPLLLEIGRTFNLGGGKSAFVAVATQVGYALGLLFFVPMGDLRERRGLIMRLFALVSVALLGLAIAPNFPVMVIASCIAGALAAVTHIVLPIAPDLAPKGQGGRAIGIVMTGLLLGILLARTFAGWINDTAAYLLRVTGHVGAFAGWRAVFLAAAVMNAALIPAVARYMPELPAKLSLNYGAAMRSLWTVFREEPLLRESGVIAGLIFASFSCFWNTLAFLMGRHGLGAGVAGSFGLVGAAGAFVASIAGRQADRRGPRYVLTIGISLLAAAYVGLWMSERVSISVAFHVVALAVGVIVLDVGAQMSQIANQTRIFALRPDARSRVNTVYMVMYFTGAAMGSALSTIAWEHWQWNGVCGLALCLLALAALRHVTGVKGKYVPQHPSDATRDFALEG